MIRVLFGWLVAVAVCFVIGAAALSYFDQQGWLAAAGGEASLSVAERAAWFGRTLYGLVFINGTGLGFGLYPVLVAMAMSIGLAVAAIFAWWTPGLRFWWYAGAGAVAMVTIFVALEMALGMMVVPGARTMAGIAAQGLAGFIAGAVFAAMSRGRA